MESKGFKEVWVERKLPLRDNGVYTFLSKKLSEEAYWSIHIYIQYEITDKKKIVQQFEINIGNNYIGLVTPEIKNEIDELGHYFQDYLEKIVSKENVTFESRAWGPPQFY